MSPDNYRPKPIHSKRMVVFGFIILILIVVVFGVWLIRRGADTVVDSRSSESQFQNWLKPTSEIKVGNYRYVSSCQLLPKPAAEAAFGAFSKTTLVQEKYLDTSSPANTTTSCVYNPVLGSGQQVKIETMQFANQADIKRMGSSLGSFDDNEVQTELDAYKKAVADKPNKTAEDFVATMERSFATYKQYKGEYDPVKLAKLQINGLIIPVSDSITGALDDFAYVGAYNNVAFTIGHSPAERKGKNGVTAYSSQELVNELLAMKKASDTIIKNLPNSSLDQSPAPTILGSTDTYGSTTILDACAILSNEVFTKISGNPQNNPVSRTTAPIDFTTKRYTKQDHKLLLPDNDCTRQTSSNTYARLDMKYGSSAEQAKRWLTDSYPPAAGDVTLQTDADWAMAYTNPLKPGSYDPIVVFRVGAYIGQINMYTRTADDQEIIATQDQYVAAINQLTASLKQNIHDIQK